MENQENENATQKENSQSHGKEFLNKLREMPYDNSKVGQVVIQVHGFKIPEENT